MTLLYVLATIFGILMGIANLPQAIKIFKRRSAKDIHPLTSAIFTLGSVIWLLYGLEIRNFPIAISNTIGIVCCSLVMIGWFLYGRH